MASYCWSRAESSGVRTVRVAVHRLRKVVELTFQASGVQLAAQKQHRHRSLSRCCDSLQTSVAFWRSAPCEELAQEWKDDERCDRALPASRRRYMSKCRSRQAVLVTSDKCSLPLER